MDGGLFRGPGRDGGALKPMGRQSTAKAEPKWPLLVAPRPHPLAPVSPQARATDKNSLAAAFAKGVGQDRGACMKQTRG
jgi:hypothetical protein